MSGQYQSLSMTEFFSNTFLDLNNLKADINVIKTESVNDNLELSVLKIDIRKLCLSSKKDWLQIDDLENEIKKWRTGPKADCTGDSNSLKNYS